MQFGAETPRTALDCRKERKKWAGKDSNLRRLCQRIYSPPPLPLGTPTHDVLPAARLLRVALTTRNPEPAMGFEPMTY